MPCRDHWFRQEAVTCSAEAGHWRIIAAVLGRRVAGGGVSWVMEGLLWVAVVVALSADLFLVELCVNRVRLIELPVRKAKA